MHRDSLPSTGFLRLPQIVGTPADSKRNIPAVPGLIPVSKSTWWAGVRAGRYPQPVKIGERCTAWRAEDIRALIESAAGAKAAA
ncbi:transcriptional regulator [Pseudoxanthomonas broegbernensis]|uniref:Transcriptional regulator n=1 Tax=Pseudoxanthomonas broegbernensis TaxID=83619 RepID=A0A7V8GQ73_9GAMM|nr:AlpA family phage regulatory protein [Pseudoxanthomonas broegbernensis]KAF1688167.1 transcriptional regulator [Pseudoxanthomonas broegbernensis]MBB6065220.1 putative DNA-binding transcriptional regulator AlpA [Pseudoxanthomonas broegbernensis]